MVRRSTVTCSRRIRPRPGVLRAASRGGTEPESFESLMEQQDVTAGIMMSLLKDQLEQLQVKVEQLGVELNALRKP